MKLKEAISRYPGLKHIIGQMKFSTPMGRRTMRERTMAVTQSKIERMRLPLDELSVLLHQEASSTTGKLSHLMGEIMDICSTLDRLASKQILDEIELFEIKRFALSANKIKTITDGWPSSIIMIDSLEVIIDILDPDKQRISSFYIYDSYSAPLAQLRNRIAAITHHSENNNESDNDITALRAEAVMIEKQIQKELSGQLSKHADTLLSTFASIVNLDILLAQLSLNRKLNLQRPKKSDGGITLEGVFHPEVKENLLKRELHYQPVTISLQLGVTLLTGANMSGKSILLQTIALCQLMYQYGFWIPATSAIMQPVESVSLIQGDLQNMQQGLSSYAAEVMAISKIVKKVRKGKSILILIDEPARTTNPTEGEALVRALVDELKSGNSASLIATHYDINCKGCKKLRTKGLKDIDNQQLTISNLNQHIDYDLVDATENNSPREALNIAVIMGADTDWIGRAADYLESKKD